VFFRMRRLPLPLLVAAVLLLVSPLAGAYALLGTPYYPWSWVARILCCFGAGVLTYLVVRRLRPTERVRRTASALAAALPAVIAAGLLLGELVAPGRGGVVVALFPLLVGSLAVADRGPAMLLSRPALVYGGHLSYALYLVHIPMLEVYWLALRRFAVLGPDTVLAPAVGVVVVLLTVPVAALGYRLVEEPARRRMRAMLPARPPSGGGRRAPAPQGRPLPAPDVLRPSAPRHAAAPGRRATLVSALIAAQNQRPTPTVAVDRYRRAANLQPYS
jgi:peptidoglycan/LPS O-acetylase OafA/YrhL